MSERYPGGLIRKTAPTVTGPTDGEGGSASGVWRLEDVGYYEEEGGWPKPTLPRELYSVGSNQEGQLGLNDVSQSRSLTQHSVRRIITPRPQSSVRPNRGGKSVTRRYFLPQRARPNLNWG